MIVLDTNVVSEVMTGVPSSPVLEWMVEQSSNDLRISVVTAMEVLYGLARLPFGRRREQLSAAWESLVSSWSASFLAVDLDTARLAGEIQGLRSHVGRPIAVADSLIAAVALRHRAGLATRNVADFAGLGLPLLNPWQTGPGGEE